MNKKNPALLLGIAISCFCASSIRAQSENGSLTLEAYRSFTEGQVAASAKAEPAQGVESLDIRAEDFENTRYLVPQEGGAAGFFATPIRRDARIVGYVAGYPVKGAALNLYLRVEGVRTEAYADLGVYLLTGERLGRIRFPIGERPVLEAAPEGSVTQKAGWGQFLACWGECIGDANYACNKDPKCAALLIGTNLVGGAVGAGGIGSFSIVAACGFACTRNPNLDLVPGY